MAYQIRDGDILSLSDEKAGALTMSVPLHDYRAPGSSDPAELWEQQAAVRIVTGYIARKISAVPFHLFERVSDTDRERITGTPLARMLRNPVRGRGWARFVEQLVLDMAVHDRWAVLIWLDDDGAPRLRRLPAERLAIATEMGEPQSVMLYDSTSSDPVLEIPLDRVLFDVAPSAIPNKLDRGNPRLVTISAILNQLDEDTEFRRQLSHNGPRIPAVIERPLDAPAWSDASWNRFKLDWSKYRHGGGSEGEVPILEDGMKMAPAAVFKPSDGPSSASRVLTIEEAAMLYGIPPELVGAREGNYSNIQALRELEYVDVLGSWVANLEAAFNTGLELAGLLADDEYVEANVEARLRGAFESEAAVLSTSVGAPWMTRNEARARKNLPALDGGDELVTPLNVLVGGQASPQDGITESGGAPMTAPEDDEQQESSVESSGKALPLAGLPLAAQPGWPEILRERDAFAGALGRFWRRQHGRIVQVAKQIEGGALAGQSGQGKASDVATWVLGADELRELLAGRGQRLAELGAAEVLSLWNPLSEGFDVEDMRPWTTKVAQSNTNRWTGTLTRVLDEIVGTDKWADFLADPGIGSRLIRRDARTWATEYAEFGRHDAASKSGLRVKTWQVWSKNPRASHAALAGTTVGINEIFPNGCAYPGDGTADAADVANCTCTVAYGGTT